jgi:uncharacterized OB-fold protein
MTASGPTIRVLPRLDEDSAFFWTSGADGVLRFLRCQACESFVHPPQPRCPICLSDYLRPDVVSGRAILESFTLNVQQWIPGSEPYLIGLVSIVEQSDVRLMTNLVDVEPNDLRIGMEMTVVFEHNNDVWLPLFAPASKSS